MGVAWCSILFFFFWTVGEIYYFAFLPELVAAFLAVVYLIGGFYLLFKTKRDWLPIAAASIVILFLFSLIQWPSSDRDWDPDQARMATVSIEGNDVSILQFRSNEYRTESDYDVNFGDFNFPLDQLTDVWFLVQRFTAIEGLAHTFLTFQIQTSTGPKFFSVSVEIRREAGETYSPIRGMYRQYELIYIFGSEEDLVGVRTVMRPNDRVYMYRANATPKQVQTLFREIAGRANQLGESPEFYNTFLNNCTNNIVRHTYQLTPDPISWLDPRIVLPGYSDRFAHAKKLIGRDGQTFDNLVLESRIDQKARRHGLEASGFSAAIRKLD